MKTVRSRLKILLAEKEVREGRSISLEELIRQTGASRSTVLRLANNTIKRVPLDELNMLCDYLGCEVGDLLRREEVGV